MTLKDVRTGKIICEDIKIADSFIDRMLGLLLKSNPRSMLFKTRFGIHTFFLKEPIDVLILDNQSKVIQIKLALQPNRLYFWNPKFTTIIELKSGKIKKSQVRKGDVLSTS